MKCLKKINNCLEFVFEGREISSRVPDVLREVVPEEREKAMSFFGRSVRVRARVCLMKNGASGKG